MKRLLSLLIVIALVITFMIISTGAASADAPEKVKMLTLVRPGDLTGLFKLIALPVTAANGAETAGEHSPVLIGP